MTDMADLQFEFHLKPDEQTGLAEYVIAFEGEVRCWDEVALVDRVVAELRGRRIDLVAALAGGMSQAELFDTLTSELAEFSETVLQDEACLLPSSELEALPAEICECVVFVAELRVDPDYRGRGLGSQLLQRMAEMLDIEHCLIALKAFPLADDLGAPAAPEDIARVQRFYARHGFVPAAGHFMVKDARLCEAMKKRLRRRRGLAAT